MSVKPLFCLLLIAIILGPTIGCRTNAGIGLDRKTAIDRLEGLDYKFEIKKTFDRSDGDTYAFGRDTKSDLGLHVSLRGPERNLTRIEFAGKMPDFANSEGSTIQLELTFLSMNLIALARLTKLIPDNKDNAAKHLEDFQNLILRCMDSPEKFSELRANGNVMKLRIDKSIRTLNVTIEPDSVR